MEVNVLALEPPVEAAVVTATGTVLVAFLGIVLKMLRRSHKKLGQVQKKTDVAVSQVQNSHRTNLRDDIDKVIAAVHRIEEMQREHSGGINGLRGDIRQERSERHELEKRVDRLYDR